MAFADLNPLGALWQGHGLRCLLLPEDAPPACSFCAEPGLRTAQPRRAAVPAARSVQPARQGSRPARQMASAAPEGSAPEQRESARAGERETTPAANAHGGERWRPLPPHVWPAPWRGRLAATRPGLVVWTYWNLGRDLCGAQDEQRQARRAFLQRLLGDLGHPAGTHTFWPACLPRGDADDAPDAENYAPHADAFWSGVSTLGARGVVVMGSAAAKALALPGGLRPLQQTRHRGHLIWVLWDVEYLLHEEQRYGAMLAFLRQALRHVIRT